MTENVLLLGWRDLDPAELPRLAEAGVVHRGARELDDAAALIADLRRRVDAVYVHIDVDFLELMHSDGVPVHQAEALVETIARELPVTAVAVTNHNPEYDPEGRTPAAALRLLDAMASAFPSHGPR